VGLDGVSWYQLPEVITFPYDISFRCTISYWKVLSEDYTYFYHTLTFVFSVTVAGPKKCCLGPQNDPKSLGPKKLENNFQNGNWALIQWNRWVDTDIHLDHLKIKIYHDKNKKNNILAIKCSRNI
jgi:hypothetical protein